ncbi:MAG: hypothetical protein QXI22_06175 [Sulfolobales archaeon]
MENKLPKDEYERFEKGVFEYIKSRAGDRDLEEILKDIEESFRYSMYREPPKNLSELSRLLKQRYQEEQTNGTIKREWKEIYTKLIFLIGYWGGLFYGRKFKDAEVKKYHMGEESGSDIIWGNADLVFIEKNTLHVVDFKLAGAISSLRRMLLERETVIPVPTYGIPVNLSLGELEFSGFVEKLLLVEERLRETEDVFIETKGLLQTTCYAVDFLCSEERDIEEVSLELLYPVSEPLNLRFSVGDRGKLKDYLARIKDLYRDIREKESLYDRISYASLYRKDRLRADIERIVKEMRKRESERISIKAGDIAQVRADVKKRLEDFVKREDDCKAIALLHSAGSGKTRSARELILDLGGKHIVLYMTTRLRILEREYRVLEKHSEETEKRIAIVYKRRVGKSGGFVKHKGKAYEEVGGKQEGILLSTVKEIVRLAQEGEYDQIWAFTTIQAVVETAFGKTSNHLEELMRPTIKERYNIHIILDEFLGYKNGLYAVIEMLDFARRFKEGGGRISLYLFDANGYSPVIMKRLLDEYEKFGVLPEAVVLGEYQEELKTVYKDIPLEIFAKHGYPSGQLYLYKKFLRISKEKEKPEKLAQYILDTFKDKKSTAFAFIQDKELIAELSQILTKHNLSTLIATASSEKSQKQINEGEEDVILGTSSISRGLDFSRSHKPVDYIYVFIQSWGIEGNLVEILQSISRARGDEETEKRAKHVHLVYLISDEHTDYRVDNILATLENPDKDIVRLVYEKEHLESFLDLDDIVTRIIEQFVSKPSDKVLVPISTQHRSIYRPNKISDFEGVMTFLEDVYAMEKNDRDIYRLLEELGGSIYTYSTLPELGRLNRFDYYHPYILIDEHPIYMAMVEKEKRHEIKKLLRKVSNTLKKHNRERTENVEKFIEDLITPEESKAPVLIPIYSLVLVKNWLGRDEGISFKIRKKVGRGHAEVLGGHLEPRTRCFVGDRIEYACIPLEEDYPYREILSGRFAKFPVRFIKSLLEA